MALLILLVPVAVVCFFQAYYLLRSLRLRLEHAPRAEAVPTDGTVGVLVPAFDAAGTLGRCLESILANRLDLVSAVVVVLDRCRDGSDRLAASFAARFAERGVPLRIVHLPPSASGKVACILHGGPHLGSGAALLVDSDIVLEPSLVGELLAFHRAHGGPFSSCLVYPLQRDDVPPTLRTHVICNNRLYRQGVLQLVKNLEGVANFPGGLQLVDYERYRELLVDGFLEDLTATYRVLATGGSVRVLPRVLAYEVERQTLQGLFLQRVRWTLGAIQHLPTQVRTAATRASWHQKVLINSYHVMWEFQHYVTALGLAAAPFAGGAWPAFVAPAALYALQIVRSALLSRAAYRNSAPGVAAHCAVFPLVISAALLGSLALLAKRGRFFFETHLLFRRD